VTVCCCSTFAWHIEDMNLYSINYLHFGESKRWYGIPTDHQLRMEEYAKSHFSEGFGQCTNFLRHKTTLISPKCLKDAGIPVVTGVQTAGDFIVTFPCGYHQGFNCGFNCAEAINFASDRWIDKARQATPCRCISDAISIDMSWFIKKFRSHELELSLPEFEDDFEPTEEQMPEIWKREQQRNSSAGEQGPRYTCAICCQGGVPPRKPGSEGEDEDMDIDDCSENVKMVQCRDCLVYVHRHCYGVQEATESADWQCDRCAEYNQPKLIRCLLCPNLGGAFKKCEAQESDSSDRWVHVQCALWIPEVDFKHPATLSGVSGMEMIGRDRWDLTCCVCRKKRKARARGACIQCSKSTCSTAYHVTCAQQSGLHIRQVSPLECAESACGTHDPSKGGMASGGIEEGQEVCWGARGFMQGKVRSLSLEHLCQVTFEGSSTETVTLPESCVKENQARVEAGNEHAVLVRWCDGKDYDAELECSFRVSTVVLEDAAGRYIGALPTSTLFPKKQAAKKSQREAGPKKRRVAGEGKGAKYGANLMTPKTKNWTVLLKPHIGKDVMCKESTGVLAWNEDKQMTEVEYRNGGATKIASMSAFEKDAGCKLKNAKVSVKLVDSGLTLGQAAAEQALQEGTARVPQADPAVTKVTDNLASELADYGCHGDTVPDWLGGLGLEVYQAGFESAGLNDMQILFADGLSETQLSAAGVTKPGHIKKLQFYLKKKAAKVSKAGALADGDASGDEEDMDVEEEEDEDEDEE